MNKQEFLRVYTIDQKKLEQYIQKGIIKDHQDYDEKVAEDISLVLTLEKIGFSMELIHEYMSLLKKDKTIQMKKILVEHRKELLENIHQQQQHLDILDYLIYTIKN